jgi:hypothetical protein
LAGTVVRIIIGATRWQLLSVDGACVSRIWTVKDCTGHVVPNFTGNSRLDVGRRLVPTHYDPFRLHVSHSYRELFDRELKKVLSEKCWQIVRQRANRRSTKAQLFSAQSNGFVN